MDPWEGKSREVRETFQFLEHSKSQRRSSVESSTIPVLISTHTPLHPPRAPNTATFTASSPLSTIYLVFLGLHSPPHPAPIPRKCPSCLWRASENPQSFNALMEPEPSKEGNQTFFMPPPHPWHSALLSWVWLGTPVD